MNHSEEPQAHGSRPRIVRSQSAPLLRPREQVAQTDGYICCLSAKTLVNWAFLVIEPKIYRHIDYERMRAMIQYSGRNMGFLVTDPKVKRFNVKMRDLKSVLLKCRAIGVRFLFVIVPNGSCYYQKTLHMAECYVGIVTHCINEANMKYMTPRKMENVLMKATNKLMGDEPMRANRSLPVVPSRDRVMIVGADVNHSSIKDSILKPSIAALTASIDTEFATYNTTLGLQGPWVEEILQIEDMMVEQLNVFVKHNAGLPERIIVYRHSTDDEDCITVMDNELEGLHRAYARMPQRLKDAVFFPEVIYLVVESYFVTRMEVNNEDHTAMETEKLLRYHVLAHQQLGRPHRMVCRDAHVICLPECQVKILSSHLSYLCRSCMARLPYPLPAFYARYACKQARPLIKHVEFDLDELDDAPQRLRVRNSILKHGHMLSE